MTCEPANLEVLSIIGFDGNISDGLKVHPDQKHVIFPLGSKISILNFETNCQQFLCGHTNTVSTIDVADSGCLIASGQINHMGFRAYVIIWDWVTKQAIIRHELHKVRVEALCFTANEEYLISLGGRDCGNLIVWDVQRSCALCGSQAARETTGAALRLCKLQRRGAVFMSGGEQNLRIWCIDERTRKLDAHDVSVGKLRREYTQMQIDSKDEHMYVGTMSGDVAKIRLNCDANLQIISREKTPVLLGVFGRFNPKKPPGKDCEKYFHGVRSIIILPSGKLIVGAGDGTVEMVCERGENYKDYPSPTWPEFKTIKKTKVNGAISSMQLMGKDTMLVGTEFCEIYSVKLDTFELKLLKTCHTSSVFDIAFPRDFSEVFATASFQSIRIWSTTKFQELLRIVVPNFSASAVVFRPDGKSIMSAWNDGAIRSFTPLTGKLIFEIPNAHNKGVSALTISSNGRVLVSGGCEGQVRIWKLEPCTQTLVSVLKEHVGPIASVQFNCFDNEVVSASIDGTCIIWDIERMIRKHVIFANTQFTCARYFPTGVQILTSGTDRRVGYWEAFDGSLVRDIEATAKGSINCIDMSPSGDLFVTVGNDQIVKVWKYQEGTQISAGYGHAAVITVGKCSPCGKFIVTGSADGAIFIWKLPSCPKPQPPSCESSARSNKCKPSGSGGNKQLGENITQLESNRANKAVLCCECPVSKNATSKSSSCALPTKKSTSTASLKSCGK